MRTEPSEQRHPLRQDFVSPRPIETHSLQPGHSMLVGYPDTEHAHKVFLVTQISDDNGVILLQTNGKVAEMTLTDVVRIVVEKDMAQPCDKRVTYGGALETNKVMMVTSQEWHTEIDSGDMGIFRLHNFSRALEHIANGDIPEKLAVFTGFTGFSYKEFMKRMQNNEFGEIALQEDMVFGEGMAGILQWNKAMSIHTRGNTGSLFVPHPTNGKNAPRPC